MLGLKRGVVELFDHQKAWEENARDTIDKLKTIFGAAAADIQHVGSTSIIYIKAKPIIDIAVAVNSFDDVYPIIPALEKDGFNLSHHAVDNDMLFICGSMEADTTTHHIHVVKTNSKEWRDYICFRNYLNANRHIAKEYEAVKLHLMKKYKYDRLAYTEAKAEFIQKALRKAQVRYYLGKTVEVTVDRPVGSVHPKHEDIIYPINYGYIDGVIAPDGEELDVYILGINEPIKTFTGTVIAIVHRKNDVEDKLVAVPCGVRMSKEKVKKSVLFQEQFYDSDIEMFFPKVIYILGASGSGTSTLGKALRDSFGYTWLDTDDYFWLNTDPPFVSKRPVGDRQHLLQSDMGKSPKCVIAGSLCGWGDMFIWQFDLVVYVDTPAEVRIARIKKREYERFGQRIKKGGDMYDHHREFIEWAKTYDTAGIDTRSRALHEKWLKAIACPVIRVCGTEPIDEILKQIEDKINSYKEG